MRFQPLFLGCIRHRCLFLIAIALITSVFVLYNVGQLNHYVELGHSKLKEFNFIPSSLVHEQNRTLALKFNLLEDDDPALLSTQVDGSECTLDIMNSRKLQQNHPCVIDIIRQKYLHPPADRDVDYDLRFPEIIEPSMGQTALRRKQFGNQTNGFFVECGAYNGEDYSNTLFMERFENWTGILIEPNWGAFTQILEVGRKSYALPVCLSVEPYPTRVIFNRLNFMGSIKQSNITDPVNIQRDKGRLMTVQCFPLYSILLAARQTRVDFFSLDVEGYELLILKTIPWHKVDIKSMTIEWHYVGQKNLTDFLGPHGYYVFAKNEPKNHQDLLFAKNETFEYL